MAVELRSEDFCSSFILISQCLVCQSLAATIPENPVGGWNVVPAEESLESRHTALSYFLFTESAHVLCLRPSQPRYRYTQYERLL